MTTITDIARSAGVSKTTVSRILNGRFDQVTPETRARVEAVIKRLDYTPSPIAKGLKSMRTNVVGIVLSDLANPFWSAVLDGIERACRTNGFSIMICNAGKDPGLEEERIKALCRKQVDGLIMNPTVKSSPAVAALIREGVPIIALNRKMRGLPVESVSVDNVRGAFLATAHLVRSGRSRIAIVVYSPDGISPRLERIEGYLAALERFGIAADDRLVHIVPDRAGAAKEAAGRMLEGACRPDAVFSTNNLMSLEIMEAIRERRIRVPEQLSFVGYDETPWSSLVDPPITVVKQPAFELGELAAERLIRQIRSGGRAEPRDHALEPSLVVRGSCGGKPIMNAKGEEKR